MIPDDSIVLVGSIVSVGPVIPVIPVGKFNNLNPNFLATKLIMY